MKLLRIFTLGGLRILLGDDPVDRFMTRKGEALLVYLASNPRPHPREILADLLWEERSQRQAQANLRVELTSLRKHLREYVTIEREIVMLDPEAAIWLDALELESKLEGLQTIGGVKTSQIAKQVEEAITLYQGDFLAGFSVHESRGLEDWMGRERERLHCLVIDALHDLVEYELGMGAYKSGLAHAARLLELDPLMEAAHCQMMRLLVYSGRRNDALEQYTVLRRLLREELGIDPAEATVTLYKKIQTGKLEPFRSGTGIIRGYVVKEQIGPVREAIQVAGPAPAEGTKAGVALPIAQPAISPLDHIVGGLLVGRDNELKQATAMWHKAMQGEGGVLFISGEPGIGKTRLVNELSAHARLAGAITLVGECYAEGSAPFSPIAQILLTAVTDFGTPVALPDLPSLVLADLITLAPHLRAQYPDVAPNPQLDPQSERQRIFESFVQFCAALSSQAPLLLVVDDAHWADGDTLALIHYLARRVAYLKLNLLLVLTYREAELAEACTLKELLTDLYRERLVTHLVLPRLNRDQTGDLLAALFAEDITAEFLEGIYLKTEGNPFFIEEVCKTLIEEGKVYRQGGRWQRPGMEEIGVPESIRMAIERRLGKLPAPTQETLLMSAILGREFDLDTLRIASEQSEEALMDALEPAERAQMIGLAEHSGQMKYAFSHALFPTVLRESMGSLHRQRLHRRALAAIESLRPDDYEALAYHAAQGGDEARARGYYTNAGDRALGAYAYHEAENHYRAALALGGTEAEQGYLSTRLGDALFNCGRYGEAEQAYREAIRSAQAIGDDDALAGLYARAADSVFRGGDIRGALDLGQEGLAKLNKANQLENRGFAELLQQVGLYCDFHGPPEEARILCEQALQIAERTGDIDLQVDVLASLGCLSNLSHEAQVEILTQAVELAKTAGIRGMPAWRARNNLVFILREGGDYRTGIGLLQQTLEEARQYGLVGIETWALVIKAAGLLFLGDLDAADELRPAIRRLSSQLGQTLYGSYLRIIENMLAYYRGNVPEPIDALASAREEIQRVGDTSTIISYGNMLAQAYLEVGEVECALGVLQENLSLEKRFSYTGEDVRTRCLLCAARLQQGDLEDAQRLLDEACCMFDHLPTPLAQSWIALAKARLAAAKEQWSEALCAYERMTQLEEHMSRRWYRAQTLCEWARVHLRRDCPGDRERAIVLLQEALSEFEAMHAPGYEEVVRKSLEVLHE